MLVLEAKVVWLTLALAIAIRKTAIGREFYMRDAKGLRSRIFANACAQCGHDLIAPEWSEHINERCIRHLWACEACGYEFETTVYLRAAAERELAA